MKHESGFTLVELSIVIVLIGLIVAGVVGGQALVQQAKLRGVLTEVEQFDVAFNTFKLEYGEPPGDLSNASSYWTGAPNGNGNGRVRTVSNSGNGHDGEYVYVWHHLGSLGSKLLPGPYDASPFTASLPKNQRDQSLPFSKIGHHWGVYNRTRWKGHQYVLGASDSGWGYYGVAPSLSPRLTLSLDNKIDDGKPATGTIIVEGRSGAFNTLHWSGALPHNPTYSPTPTAGNCTANGAASYDTTAEYNAGFNNVSCIPVFRYKMH